MPDRLQPAQFGPDLGNVSPQIRHICFQLRQIGFRRDAARHPGPNGIGDRLGLIGVKTPGLNWRVTARVSNAASTMPER